MKKILGAGYETCIYCGATMPIEQAAIVPPIGDDEAWERLAAYHHDDCEWIATRALRETK